MTLAEITIKLPQELVTKILADIEGTSFENVESFVEDLVKKKYPELNDPVYTPEEEEMIRNRLRRLGYIE